MGARSRAYTVKKIVSNLVEQEILVLNAANYTLREMHNRVMISFCGDLQSGQTLKFESITAKNLYFILMADFLANMREEYLVDKNKISILDALLGIAAKPLLGTKKSAKCLKSDLVKLKKWLEYEAVIKKMWFPNINKEMVIKE